MATDPVEKCAIAASLADNSHNGEPFAQNYRNIALAVIDALADGVSDEMCAAAYEAWHAQERSAPPIRAAIAAAIRASREGNGNG